MPGAVESDSLVLVCPRVTGYATKDRRAAILTSVSSAKRIAAISWARLSASHCLRLKCGLDANVGGAGCNCTADQPADEA